MELTGERWIQGRSEPRIEVEHVARYRFAEPYVAGKDVLDIACGSGAGSFWMVQQAGARSVLGVDIDPESVQYAQANYQCPGLRFESGNAEQLVADTRFDVVVCYETIEHVDNDLVALRNLFGLLKPGGVLLLSTPNRPITSPRADTINDKPDNPFHRREYVLTDLRAVLREAGFAIVSMNGQRFRTHFASGSMNRVADLMRALIGYKPDFQSSPAVRRYHVALRKPRNWVLVCRKTST